MSSTLYSVICSGQEGGDGDNPCHQTKTTSSQLWHHQPECESTALIYYLFTPVPKRYSQLIRYWLFAGVTVIEGGRLNLNVWSSTMILQIWCIKLISLFITLLHCCEWSNTRGKQGDICTFYDSESTWNVNLCLSGRLFMSPQWINSRTLVLVDSHEKLQVVDRPSQEVLETLDLDQVQLVYNSRHFKSLATGGNVSQALVRGRLKREERAQNIWMIGDERSIFLYQRKMVSIRTSQLNVQILNFLTVMFTCNVMFVCF